MSTLNCSKLMDIKNTILKNIVNHIHKYVFPTKSYFVHVLSPPSLGKLPKTQGYLLRNNVKLYPK